MNNGTTKWERAIPIPIPIPVHARIIETRQLEPGTKALVEQAYQFCVGCLFCEHDGPCLVSRLVRALKKSEAERVELSDKFQGFRYFYHGWKSSDGDPELLAEAVEETVNGNCRSHI